MKPGTDRVCVVILAAGGSKRLGSPKQLLLYHGTSLIRHLAKTALDSRATSVAVILGAFLDRIEPELGSMPVILVRNPDWEQGMGSSIRRAVEAMRNEADAILFTASDQPLVTTPVLNSLIEQFRSSGDRIVASEYSNTLGIPAVFPGKYFDELIDLSGEAGAKSIIMRHKSTVLRLPFPDGAVDIDQLSDLRKLM